MDKQVVLMVNSECNSKCKHCYISYKGHREPANVLELVDRFHDQGYKVTIAGSETLLNREYLRAYKRVGQKYLLTNGILLLEYPEIIEELCQNGIEEIHMSLHFGIQRDLESVSEENVIQALKIAKKGRLKTIILTTITQRNYRDVLNMCEKAFLMGVDGIKFIRYIDSCGKLTDTSQKIEDYTRREFFDLIDSARDLYDKDRFKILIHGNFGPKKGSKGEQLSKCNRYCPAGIDLFAIDPNDNVYGCPFLMKFPIGRVSNGRIIVDRRLYEGRRDRCLTDYVL